MSEATLRFRLYGAIDDAIVADHSLIGNAAEVLPNYVKDRDDLARKGQIQNTRRPVMTPEEWLARNPPPRELAAAQVSGARDEPSAAAVDQPRLARLATTTLGWMGAFSQLQREPTERPTVGDVLREMAAPGRSPSQIDIANQARALWTATNIFGAVIDEDVVSALTTTLSFDQSDGLVDDPRERATRLKDLFRGYSSAADVANMSNKARSEGLVSPTVAQLMAIDCEDDTVYFTRGGGREVAARIITRIDGAPGSWDLDSLCAELQPVNWPNCLSTFWCSMEPIAGRSAVWNQSAGHENDPFYRRECVGDCPTRWFEPYLKFACRTTSDGSAPNGFELQYDLCTPQECINFGVQQDDRLLADAGVVRLRKNLADNSISVWTSKVISFAPPLPSGGMAMVACASGWADHSKAMLTGCFRP